MTLLRQRGALPGLEAISRLAGGRASGKAPTQPAPFADVGSRAEVREVRADIRRDIRALNRLSDKDGSSIVEVEHTLSEVYSAPVLATLGEQGRRAFAARVAGRTQAAQRIRVLDFQGSSSPAAARWRRSSTGSRRGRRPGASSLAHRRSGP